MFLTFNALQTFFFEWLKCVPAPFTIFEEIAPCKTCIIDFWMPKSRKFAIYEILRFYKDHFTRRYFHFGVILWMALFKGAIRIIQKSFSTSMNTLKLKIFNSALHIMKKQPKVWLFLKKMLFLKRNSAFLTEALFFSLLIERANSICFKLSVDNFKTF